METIVANRGGVYLPYLFRKIEILPSAMQEEVLLFTDFLINKSKAKSVETGAFDFDAEANDNFSGLSLLSLSKEWNSSEDEEWDTILSQMPSIQ